MRILSPEERLRRAASFNEAAEKYDRARPTYPDALYDELWRLANLGPEPDVVEVGCGTGQASASLARRGARLTCVEFGENMAALARRKLSRWPSASVVVSKFEDWDSRGEEHDLVFASASWHWIKPDVRYAKAASVLKPGASLAVVHSDHVFPKGYDPLYGPIQDVYGTVTGKHQAIKVREIPAPGELDKDDLHHIEELNRTGAYDRVSVARILWHFDRTADGYIDLLGTYSDNWALEPDVRERLFDAIHRVIAQSAAGKIRKHYLTTLRIARRAVDGEAGASR
ncbi:MAG: class I SAM-dependent methyltransferase [Fimbriimonadaceae bacterium]